MGKLVKKNGGGGDDDDSTSLQQTPTWTRLCNEFRFKIKGFVLPFLMELSFDFILLQVLRKRRRRQIDLQVFLSRCELELPLIVISSWITTSPSKNCFHSPLKFIIDPFNGERAAMKSRFTNRR